MRDARSGRRIGRPKLTPLDELLFEPAEERERLAARMALRQVRVDPRPLLGEEIVLDVSG
jgi:hypothetical protein